MIASMFIAPRSIPMRMVARRKCHGAPIKRCSGCAGEAVRAVTTAGNSSTTPEGEKRPSIPFGCVNHKLPSLPAAIIPGIMLLSRE
jgi:hypothetical protein